MKFIVDGMLGKLTRWLRMLGHNVKYSNKLDDLQLIEIAKKEHRILLTRDLELYQQATAKGVQALYMDGQTEAERLAKLAQKFKISLDVDMAKSRCPKCNARVKPVPKEKVEGKVEKTTFYHYNEFWECPKCGQIYWQGAHWTRIRETLKTAKRNLNKAKA
ncbi:MAG: Mut7-C RNAse domain-containing protein [Nitrososphaerota archaeon]|nr:Mut7-C RNAse domain-containing protein [Candidatus Bathyarchaeota archaeon]MDW8023261.1 Mut7-C RNAse domain-containing protein [Nitrososphaerota archaeon]